MCGIDEKTLRALVEAGAVDTLYMAKEGQGWGLAAQVGRSTMRLATKRGEIRRFASADAAARLALEVSGGGALAVRIPRAAVDDGALPTGALPS